MKTATLVLFILTIGLLPITAQEANLTDGCVADYDAAVDYFPQKVEVVDAVKFSVEYFNHYKVISVADAFEGAPGFEYVLLQCGAPAPAPKISPLVRNSSPCPLAT